LSLVRVGRIGRPHGLHGEVVLDATDLTPLELHAVRTFTWRGKGGASRGLTLRAARPAHDRTLVAFDGIGSRAQAAELTLGELWADDAALPDPGPGRAYEFQLVGLKVVETGGRELGVIESVIHTGAHPVYVVQGARELLIPATDQVVRAVDLGAGVVTVTLPAGLEEL
jgi:16S rRNA processing protein RimM